MSTTTDQRFSALERANEIRLSRADLKRRIATAQTPVTDVIADPPPEAQSWPVGQVLAAQHRWGVRRTRKTLARLMIPETKPLGMLTQRQRARIVAALRQGTGGRG